MSYLVRRLIRAILLLVGISALCFLFTEMAPGSFFDEMRVNPQISPETIAGLRAQYGLDQPLAVRYGRWMKSALHADLGYSIAYNTPVAPLLWSRAKNTLLLTITAMILTWLISVPVGLWAAARRGGLLDRAITVVSSLLIAVPEIVIAIALLAIAVRWRLAPVGGMMSNSFDALSGLGKVSDLIAHLKLPVVILVLCESAMIVRHIRASGIEVLRASYIAGRARPWNQPWQAALPPCVASGGESGDLSFRIFAGGPPQRIDAGGSDLRMARPGTARSRCHAFPRSVCRHGRHHVFRALHDRRKSDCRCPADDSRSTNSDRCGACQLDRSAIDSRACDLCAARSRG